LIPWVGLSLAALFQLSRRMVVWERNGDGRITSEPDALHFRMPERLFVDRRTALRLARLSGFRTGGVVYLSGCEWRESSRVDATEATPNAG